MSTVPDTFADQTLRALVDRLLLEQGLLDPLELLLATELLDYRHYEAWRLGRAADLQGMLAAAPAVVVELLERAGSYARGQGLEAGGLQYTGWGAFDRPLHIGTDIELARACATAYAPPADRRQLDLFHDSSGRLLEEDIRRALAERRTEQAREDVARLMRQQPGHADLHGFLRLIQAIDDSDSDVSPRERLAELDAIEPLARQLLGHRARDFLPPLWSALAEQLAGVPFDPVSPRLHASHAWMRAGRWDAARAAVEAEPHWQAEPGLLLVHAEVCWRRRDQAAARRDWMQLCWEHPLAAERAFAAPTFPDARIADLWNAFGDSDEALDTEDFPAWLLLQDPTAASAVPGDAAPMDERGSAYRLLHRLVCGAEDIDLRRQLAEADTRLLRLFLSRRQ